MRERLQALLQQYISGQIDLNTYASQANPLIEQARTSGELDIALMEYSPYKLAQDAQTLGKQQYMQKLQQLGGVMQGAVDLTQLGMAYDQIKTANSAAGQSAMPQPPAVPELNPQLSEELYNAQRRAWDISYATLPAQQQLQQGYQQALGQAQSASGGQSSNYQALANLANQQRMQAAVNLVPLAQQARMENQGIVNQLLGQRLQEQQNQFQNQFSSYQPQYEQFNMQQQAIGALGSQGRTRAFDVISRLPEYLNYLPFDDDSNNFIRNTRKETDARLGNQYGRGGQLGFYQPEF